MDTLARSGDGHRTVRHRRTIASIGTAPAPGTCPVCGRTPAAADPTVALARHLVDEAARSDVGHVMWLNRNVTKRRVGADELAGLLTAWLAGAASAEDRVRR